MFNVQCSMFNVQCANFESYVSKGTETVEISVCIFRRRVLMIVDFMYTA